MKPYYEDTHCRIYHGDCREVLPGISQVDHIITDPPYSERTHSGHDASAKADNSRDKAQRKALNYDFLTPEDCGRLAAMFACQSTGWIVWMSDHALVPAIEVALQEQDRYVFAPLPYFHPGSRVRLSGDGPSSWTVWINVARTRALSRWGTLPGGYVAKGRIGSQWVGAKPLSVMQEIVRDYSHPGQTILDPYMGSGTTLLAAKNLGRKAIGIEMMEAGCEMAAKRLAQECLFNRENTFTREESK